ncbi:MAG: hypothetical protein R8K20_05455 [Gallionellaceae bacterium]
MNEAQRNPGAHLSAKMQPTQDFIALIKAFIINGNLNFNAEIADF